MLNEVLARLTRKAENRMVPLLLFAGLALVSVVFASTVLFRMVSVSEKVSAEIGNILADDMLHNEDLADVISLLYFRLNNTRQSFSAPASFIPQGDTDCPQRRYGAGSRRASPTSAPGYPPLFSAD
jgi:hypothetical protein